MRAQKYEKGRHFAVYQGINSTFGTYNRIITYPLPNMKRFIYTLLCVSGMLMTACQSADDQAAPLLQQAEKLFHTGKYDEARAQIDSIRIQYPKAFKVRKEAIRLMQDIDLLEQRQLLTQLDSAQTAASIEFDELKGKYIFEKNAEYQEIGNFFFPAQVANPTIQRSFLRPQVNEKGEMRLTSIYAGGGEIQHTAILLSATDGSQVKTEKMADFYETSPIAGRKIELADFLTTENRAVLDFLLAQNTAQGLKLQFIGKRTVTVPITNTDLQAVKAVHQLATVLQRLSEIARQREETELKIRFIERKRQEMEVDSTSVS